MAPPAGRIKRLIRPETAGSLQYTSVAFGKRCEEAGVRPSMGSVGDCYDNAMCESFNATLECELLVNTAEVHLTAACGAWFCSSMATVQADLKLTLHEDGSVTIEGKRTQFPSFEAYAYDGSHTDTLAQGRENPENYLGASALMKGEDTLVKGSSGPDFTTITDKIRDMDPL